MSSTTSSPRSPSSARSAGSGSRRSSLRNYASRQHRRSVELQESLSTPYEQFMEEGDGRPRWGRNAHLLVRGHFVQLMIIGPSLGPIFDTYLLELAKDQGSHRPNTVVGLFESVRGFVSLVLQGPVGCLDECMNRQRMLQMVTCLGTFGVGLMIFGVFNNRLELIYVSVVFLAIFMLAFGIVGTSLLKDSVAPNHLHDLYEWRRKLQVLGVSCGPVAQAIVIFAIDRFRYSWDLHHLHFFVCASYVLWPILVLGSLFLIDTPRPPPPPVSPNGVGVADQSQKALNDQRVCGMKKLLACAILIELSDLLMAVGVGMTTKFFPIFFKEEFSFSPLGLCALNCGYTTSITVFNRLVSNVNRRLGFSRASFLYHAIGTACLFVMAGHRHLPLTLVAFVLRGSLMNARTPVNEAIVLHCRKHWSQLAHRRFKIFSSFCWSGSAALGGVLVDKGGYRHAFFVAGLIYTVAAVVWIPLVTLISGDVVQGAPASASQVPLQRQAFPNASFVLAQSATPPSGRPPNAQRWNEMRSTT